jgi:plasmid stabilization system protein ParE
MKIEWADPAIESLRNLHGYIAKDSEVYASSFVQRIVLAVEKLTNFPRLGRWCQRLTRRRFENSSIKTTASSIILKASRWRF